MPASRMNPLRALAASLALWLPLAAAQAPPADGAAASAPAGAAVTAAAAASPAPLEVLTLPAQALPAVRGLAPSAEALVEADPRAGSIQFIGTATVLIRVAGLTILTDPNFLHQGEMVPLGYGLRSRRLTQPAIAIDKLPPIDLVLLSHFHGDHFDQRVQRQLNRSLPIVTTRAAERPLRRLEFTAVRSLATWQTLEVVKGETRLRITALPARHGPPIVNRALPEVMGSLLEFRTAASNPWRLYVSGDTTIHQALREIPQRHPDIDLALLHLGGTRVGGVLVTMDAAQGIEALRIVQPKQAIPIHYNDYEVFKSPLADFVQAVRQAGLQDKVTYLAHGDSHRFELPPGGR